MHCDEVFATLTRGPFPTGRATDGEVERHLANCESCRAIAAALAPNDDSPASRAATRLPCYRGAAVSSAEPVTARAAGLDAEAWRPPSPAARAGAHVDWPRGFQLASVTLPDRTRSSRAWFFWLVGASAMAVAAWAILASIA